MMPVDIDDYMLQSLKSMVYDPQAQYLYKAEEDALYPGKSLDETMAMPARFASSKEATQWAREVQRNPKVAALWPRFAASRPLNVTIEHLPYGAGARTENGTDEISLSDNGFGNSEESLLHEIAHVIVGREYQASTSDMRTDEGHGPLFSGVYLRLMKEIKGDAVAATLAQSMKKNRVQVTEVTR